MLAEVGGSAPFAYKRHYAHITSPAPDIALIEVDESPQHASALPGSIAHGKTLG